MLIVRMFPTWVGCIILLLFTAPSPIWAQEYQLIELASPQVPESDSILRFENDKVAVTYTFWSVGGRVTFVVHNKTDKPLYIDWTRSAFVLNGRSFPYYSTIVPEKRERRKQRKQLAKHASLYDVAIWAYKHNRKELLNYVTLYPRQVGELEPEETTPAAQLATIPPQAWVRKSMYYIQTRPLVLGNLDSIRKLMESRNYRYTKQYTVQNTPIMLANQISYTDNPGSTQRSELNHTFYYKSVSYLRSREFAKVVSWNTYGPAQNTYPFLGPKRFGVKFDTALLWR